jgi:nicotinate-nucleotide pyrophosphorylase (carboxylating)
MKFTAEHISTRLEWDDIDPFVVVKLAQMAQEEDLRGVGLREKPLYQGDLTTSLLGKTKSIHAKIVTREQCVVSGLETVQLILQVYGAEAIFIPQVKDQAVVSAGTVLGSIGGFASGILKAERPILNTLQHLCGIATQTHCYVSVLGGSSVRLLDTRKTLPGWRVLEKYAVACGGGYNHRIGLFDRVLLKDNHLALGNLGDLKAIVAQSRARYPEAPIEVEVDHLEQIPAVLEAKPDGILLDNFSNTELKEALNWIQGLCYTEASGGITLERLSSLGKLPLDFISTSQLTRSFKAIDIGLDF